MFAQIDEWILILKIVENKVFLMKPKHQYHLFWWGECVYGAQSWKERGLLCEFMLIPIDKWTFIPIKRGKWGFSYKTKALLRLSQRREWIYGA